MKKYFLNVNKWSHMYCLIPNKNIDFYNQLITTFCFSNIYPSCNVYISFRSIGKLFFNISPTFCLADTYTFISATLLSRFWVRYYDIVWIRQFQGIVIDISALEVNIFAASLFVSMIVLGSLIALGSTDPFSKVIGPSSMSPCFPLLRVRGSRCSGIWWPGLV